MIHGPIFSDMILQLPLSVLVAVTLSGILFVTFNSNKLGIIDFTKNFKTDSEARKIDSFKNQICGLWPNQVHL